MHAKFNKWELESTEGSWFDLKPAGAPSEGGADWWSVSIQAGSNNAHDATMCMCMTPYQLGCLMGMGCEQVYSSRLSSLLCMRALNCFRNHSQLPDVPKGSSDIKLSSQHCPMPAIYH